MTDKRFNPDKAEVLYSEVRRAMLPVEEVITYLNLRTEDTVADLGAGNGYFTIPLAKKTESQVYAVDIEPKMLALLKVLAVKEELANIRYIQSDLEDIQLKNHTMDKVVAAFVIHEVPDMPKAISEARRILKSDGTLLVVEWEDVPTQTGPLLEDKISSQEMTKLLEQSGFFSEVIHLNESYYAIIAKPI